MTRSITFETARGPMIFTADELEFATVKGDRNLQRISRFGEPWRDVRLPVPAFVRKLARLYCTDPGDETVGEIREALPDRHVVELSKCHAGTVERYDGDGGPPRVVACAKNYAGSILAAIRSLAKPEPTKDDLLADLLKHLKASHSHYYTIGRQHYTIGRQLVTECAVCEAIATAEKLTEDSR